MTDTDGFALVADAVGKRFGGLRRPGRWGLRGCDLPRGLLRRRTV